MIARPVIFAIAVFSVPAAAADKFVDRADADNDGYVSLHELRAAHYADPEFNRRIEQAFERYDLDGDGLISERERREMRAAKNDDGVRAESTSDRFDEAKVQLKVAPALVPPADAGRSVPEPRVDRAGSTPAVASQAGPARRTTSSSGASRTETWIREIDADHSGGASMAELLASGDGAQWFRKEDFRAADKNGDGDLDADELARLIASLERRQRR